MSAHGVQESITTGRSSRDDTTSDSAVRSTRRAVHSQLAHEEVVTAGVRATGSGAAPRVGRRTGPVERPAPAEAGTRTAALVAAALFLVWLPVLGLVLPPTSVWVAYWTLAAMGAATLPWASRRGLGAPVALFALIGVWVALQPKWSAWGPTIPLVRLERNTLLAAALIVASLTLLGGGRRCGVLAHRRAWVAVLVTTVPMGFWEVLTHRHFTPAGRYEPPAWSPSAVFSNPNNFAVVLTVGVGLCLLAATERAGAVRRLLWVGLAAACGVLVWFTVSRLALVACALMVVVAAHLWAVRAGVTDRARTWARHHWGVTAGALVTMAAAVVISFAVPALRAVNPVARMLHPGDAGTVKADGLRAHLVTAGLDFWHTSPWFGIGGGRFEVLLRRTRPDIGVVTPMHNGFVEILVEYGVAVAAFLAVLLLVLAALTVWPRRTTPAPRGRATIATDAFDVIAARHLLAVYLTGFVLAGVLISTPLPWTPWWMLLASAVAAGWWVEAELLDAGRPR